MEKQELKALIKETIREVIQEERYHLCQILIPNISDREQQEIEAELGLPSTENNEELIDLTDWVKHSDTILQTSN